MDKRRVSEALGKKIRFKVARGVVDVARGRRVWNERTRVP